VPHIVSAYEADRLVFVNNVFTDCVDIRAKMLTLSRSSFLETAKTEELPVHCNVAAEYSSELLHNLNLLFADECLCDVGLVVSPGRLIRAHRCVLSAASPYFHAMLTGGLRESGLDIIDMQAVGADHIIEKLVAFIYTGLLFGAFVHLFTIHINRLLSCVFIYLCTADANNVYSSIAVYKAYYLWTQKKSRVSFLVEKKTCTRKHATYSKNLYKSTGTSSFFSKHVTFKNGQENVQEACTN